MKRHLYAIAFGLCASAASAGITENQVVSLFQSTGYTNIEVTTKGGQMKVDATQNGVRVEVTYDVASGQILHQEKVSGGSAGGLTIAAATGSTSGTNTGMTGGSENEGAGHEQQGSDDNGTEDSHSGSGGSGSGGSGSGGSDHHGGSDHGGNDD